MKRQELIDQGKIWHVYWDAKPDEILFEGSSRTAALKWIKQHHNMRLFRTGAIRVGKVIWEQEETC